LYAGKSFGPNHRFMTGLYATFGSPYPRNNFNYANSERFFTPLYFQLSMADPVEFGRSAYSRSLLSTIFQNVFLWMIWPSRSKR